jgi:asparagine synthase (glutamine-hydrolysing)
MMRALPLNPDSGAFFEATWQGGGLGVNEQSISAKSKTGNSGAFYQADSLTIACVGEFYDAGSDNIGNEAAFLAEQYRLYGNECAKHLRGRFALAIWDGRKKQLLLATDPFAVENLYYFADSGNLVFASRINSILKAPGVPREIYSDSIYDYLYFSCIPTPYTIYRKIFKLPPGHLLCFSEKRVKIEPYWSMRYDEEKSGREDSFASGIRNHLSRAVHSHALYGDTSIGIGSFLSGGTDSSTISGMLGQTLKKPAPTFSIGFKESEFSEIEYARIAARHFGTDYHDYFVNAEDTAKIIPAIVAAYDEPFGNASAVPAYYCAKLAHDHGIGVLLAGDGGDELFGGNSRYADDKVFEVYTRMPSFLTRYCIEPVLFRLPLPDSGIVSKARKYIRRANLPQPKRFFSYNLLYTIEPREMFTGDFLSTLTEDPGLAMATQHYKNVSATAVLNRQLHIDLKITISDNDLRKVDRMCDLAGVKARYPMLDLDLVEFSGKIPANIKVKGFEKRYIFKKAFRDFLPPEILQKQKHGFGLPISGWLRTDRHLAQLSRDTLLSRSSLERGYFKPEFIKKLFDLHSSDQTNFFGDNLWIFLMLELWHQRQPSAN